ncbi:MAG: PaaI family thioesterase [Pseudobdellovibrionaceae bacterium]|uniref:PaaI family thioesterase n=1 Tax=Oligoflexus sp. TaxID=1971216 RepID=UPI0027CB7E40|nr:PaaI family thioesterase [Oligoflexus sp.]MDQ3230496.1 PaaI family thioesterase [Pseudobdellovibrionaceae bacterium]HYX38343.1 PaaI family thioesterase [Oligoflexus sp.]
MSIFPASLQLDELNKNWRPQAESAIGMHFIEVGENSLTAELTVGEAMLQPHGIMHGGFSCLIGEGLGSVAGNLCLKDPTLAVVGQNLQALHLRPAKPGDVLRARVQPVHIGRRSQIWETEIRDRRSDKLIARVTLTVAVVERPS